MEIAVVEREQLEEEGIITIPAVVAGAAAEIVVASLHFHYHEEHCPHEDSTRRGTPCPSFLVALAITATSIEDYHLPLRRLTCWTKEEM
jgi:hypothetical protein